MNNLELIQAAKTECMPKMAEAVSKLRIIFPKFELKPSTLERTPSADTFVTAMLEQDGANSCNLINDYIDVATEKVRSRLTTNSYVNKAQNLRSFSCKLEEFNADNNVAKEVYYDSHGLVKGIEHEYNSMGNRIQTREMLPTYKESGIETITTFDAKGRETCIEKLYRNQDIANTKKVINPDGSYVRTIHQKRVVGTHQLKADTIEEYTSNGKLSKITQTLNGETESLIELNSNGKIIKLDVPDLLANGKGRTRLKVEYAPEYPYPNAPKSVEVAHTDGTIIYSATYKDGIPMEVKGTVVDKMKKDGLSIKEIEVNISTPHIVPEKGIIGYNGLDNYYPRIFWKENILSALGNGHRII